MDHFGILKVSASAMDAQRKRMNIIASNMANVHTSRTGEGGPYRRKDVVFSVMPVESKSGERILEGVRLMGVVEDNGDPLMVYDPGHPDADDKGYVAMPKMSVVEEMANMMMALRAYEASVAAFNMSKTMMAKTLEIGRQ